MLGRKLFSTGLIAAIIAAVAIGGGCNPATTGPADSNNSSFASAIRLVSGNAQTGQIGAALSQPLSVKVVDQGGLPVQGATVTFAVRSGGGAILPPTGTSDVSGLVTANWTLGATIGSQTAVAILSGSFVSDSTKFTATATTGPGAVFTMVSGNNQAAVVATTLTLPLVVKVTDSFGNKIPGARVTWTPGNLSGSASPPSDTTGADGTASSAWTLGNTAATQTLSASVPGLPPIVFTAVASADAAHITVTRVTGALPQSAIYSTLPALTVRVIDQYGNPIIGDSITWTDSIMGGGKVSATKTGTDATGTASTTWTLGGRAGTQFLRAKEGSLGVPISFTDTALVAFTDVESGNFQACGVAQLNNQVYCWGLGDAGQLGKGTLGNTASPTVPVPLPSGDTLKGPFLTVRQLFPARGYMCALTAARQMYCWGDVIGGTGAVLVPTFQNITDNGTTVIPNFLANGEEHQCVLTLAGQAVCTGFGRQGQIGNNAGVSTAANTYSLVSTDPADAGAPTVYAAISAGKAFNCGMSRFDNANQHATQTPWCWGFNGSGQIGNGTTTDALEPAKVTMPSLTTNFDSSTVSAGGQHACAIEAIGSIAVGNAWCWGSNGFGQLGSAASFTNSDRFLVPQPVIMTGVPTGGFAKIYAGEFHTCALTPTGAAYCWGRNDLGQVGNGTTSATGVASPVAVSTGVTFRSLSLGELFTCGVTGTPGNGGPSQTAGTIYCWGDNLYGQLGTGSASGGASPTTVPTKIFGQP